jgi:LysR family transcriptional regulator, transcriptional activator of the cysJI operon
MQLESLKTFCDLVETESFTKAAQINEVTQSAISQQVAAMEKRFQSLLVERSKKVFRLTREGQVVYDYSRRISRTYEELNNKLAELKDHISGTIRMAVIYTFGLYDLPPYLKKYLQKFPTVNVHVEYLPASQIYEDVMGNALDLGLVGDPVSHPRLKIHPLRRDRLVLISHPNHPLAKHKSVRLADLTGQQFINFGTGVPLRKTVDKMLRSHKAQVLRAMEFDNIETIKRAVEIEAGVAIVPESTVVQDVKAGSMARMLFKDGEFYRQLAVIHKSDKLLTRAMKEFIAVLKEG